MGGATGGGGVLFSLLLLFFVFVLSLASQFRGHSYSWIMIITFFQVGKKKKWTENLNTINIIIHSHHHVRMPGTILMHVLLTSSRSGRMEPTRLHSAGRSRWCYHSRLDPTRAGCLSKPIYVQSILISISVCWYLSKKNLIEFQALKQTNKDIYHQHFVVIKFCSYNQFKRKRFITWHKQNRVL